MNTVPPPIYPPVSEEHHRPAVQSTASRYLLLASCAYFKATMWLLSVNFSLVKRMEISCQGRISMCYSSETVRVPVCILCPANIMSEDFSAAHGAEWCGQREGGAGARRDEKRRESEIRKSSNASSARAG